MAELNILEKIKGMFGGAFADADAVTVGTEVEKAFEWDITHTFNNAANANAVDYVYVPATNAKLLNAYWCPDANIAADTANYATFTLTSNSVALITATNTLAAGMNGVTAGTAETFTVNDAAVCESAKPLVWTVLQYGGTDSPATNGQLVLRFRHIA